jgi:hypothetical protein
MTPKEKAEDLLKKYIELSGIFIGDYESEKEMSLIVVDEIIQQLNTIDFDKQSEDYEFLINWWGEVKEEINNFDNTKK